MPQFAYWAKRDVATEARGVLEAQDLPAAILTLKTQGLYPLDVHPITPRSQGGGPSPGALPAVARPRPRRLAAPHVALWARTLAQGLHGGLTLVQALHLLVEQQAAGPLKATAIPLREGVSQGQPLSQAMRAAAVFAPVTLALVEAGEHSGSLEQALDRIAQAAERQADLQGKIRAAVAYPALILIVGGLTTAVLITVVVPQLAGLFAELGQPLPWPTRLMVALRGGVVGLLLAALALAVAVPCWLRGRAWRARLLGAAWRLAGRLPVLGPWLRQAEWAGWSGTLGLMLRQGVALPEAVRLANQAVGDPALQQRLARVESDVVEGVRLSESLTRTTVATPLLVTMTAIGEAEGALDASLLTAASTFEREVDQGMKMLTALVEPLLILAVGSVVAAVVFSMLLPIFQINFTAT